jgi:hypothetical protein
MSDVAATRFRDAPLERYPYQARKWIGARQHCCVSRCAFVDQGHDVVTVSAIVDSGDPRWIGRGGKGDRGEQDQCHNDRKDGVDRAASGAASPTRLHLVLRTRIPVHLKPPIGEQPEEKRDDDRCLWSSLSRGMLAVSTCGPSKFQEFVGPLALYALRGKPLALGDLFGVGGGGARPRRLRRVVGGEIGHVGIGEIFGEGRHLRILAPAVAKLDELPVGEETGWPARLGVPGKRLVNISTWARGGRLPGGPPVP